ncbi:uncharacterized protein N7459_007306 [Penicillium hispanicum]|uniref:uncharacterized protein n=1 Tax=Penicillium hispanicum TaxID=1080232 RepID=UPI002540252A|nr:uncharacterized protein N7459_007306 [Penicillium hispanicum]KAJ5578342.1 hypothetical protein N7459_007306 [Penicillium hispanicum]
MANSLSLSWMLVALFLLIVHPVTSHPIQASTWTETNRFKDPEPRGSRNALKKIQGTWPELSHTKFKSASTPVHDDEGNIASGSESLGRHHTSGFIFEKPIIPVLVPVSVSSAWKQHQKQHHHVEEQNHPNPEIKPIATYREDQYGEIVGRPHTSAKGLYGHPTEYYSASSRLSSGHYLPFFSYRMSFPYLKSAPVTFPQIPLPGVFTAVMVLLALVWITIVTIGVVEFGNHLWNRRRVSRLAAECDRDLNEEPSFGSMDEVKMPLHTLYPGNSRIGTEEESRNEDSESLSSDSDSDSDFEPERVDYRIF